MLSRQRFPIDDNHTDNSIVATNTRYRLFSLILGHAIVIERSGQIFFRIKTVTSPIKHKVCRQMDQSAPLMLATIRQVLYRRHVKDVYKRQILASPTETMADGWPYEEMMPQLFATDLQLEKVGETFYNHYLNNTYPYATVSLTKTSELDNLKSVTHDILADKTESDIYSLDPKKMQRLEYL